MLGVDVRNGVHCSLPSCREFDFLPFTCDACGKDYCKDHIGYTCHGCQEESRSVQVVICPLCNQSLRVTSVEDPNTVWEAHFASGCKQVPKKTHRCPVVGCKEQLGSSNRFDCQRCGQTVCLKHRYEDDHACTPKGAPPSKVWVVPLPGVMGRGSGKGGSASEKQKTNSKKPLSQRIASMFACKKGQEKSPLLD
eukprot:CAMPEP_0194487180 /NCGR_PEP_ID=MMETSP0253-20130528/7553_1 /TAXON_ID=2966 /ORGANISM="Noctiluca scintillans" /LENGTH=193 /DNA_ID=CAMNT_0039327365 /DNA_START=22 /DNA_END=603 /DNA_ORIENTATION=+